MIAEHFHQGVLTLAANKVRTSLSLLGILIGVAAVVAMMALGRGAQKAIEEQLASLGSNLLVLRPGAIRTSGSTTKLSHDDAGLSNRLTVEDADAIVEKVPSVRQVGGAVSGKTQATFANKNWSTTLQGVSATYADMHASQPEQGRFFTDDEDKRRLRLAVIGTTVMRELFGDANPIGELIKLNKVGFQVIGVLPEKGANAFRDQDDIILVPLQTAMHRALGKAYVDSIDIEMASSDLVDEERTTSRALCSPAIACRWPCKTTPFKFTIWPKSKRHSVKAAKPCRSAGLHCRDFPRRRRHRHYEHHAGLGHRAHQRGSVCAKPWARVNRIY